MLAGMPSLSHAEQQDAVERIHQLIAEGKSSGEAIAIVAQQIRENHQGDSVAVMFDDEEEDEELDHDGEEPLEPSEHDDPETHDHY